MPRLNAPLLVVAFFALIATPAPPTLIDRGGGLIYDTDLDITWYDYSSPGNTWDNQLNWADALTVDFGGTTYNDWRLPTARNPDGTGPCSSF